ncbi:EamA/RhaT family transporter, partial [Turicibacter sanguinis]|nr:EamA/RhaT family transporter [Turicibacter sanguinis]
MNSKIADGLLLLVAIIWGGGFPAVGLAVQEGVGASQLIT